MIILVSFAFLAGIVTILSPCILPILPIILSGSVGEGKKRPIGVVVGFVLSFTFFTLFLASIVRILGISADILRTFSVIVILIFGFSLLVPKVQFYIEQLFVRLSRFTPKTQGGSGFLGGLFVGLSIGLIWTPCVGPILASVISLALSGEVSATAVIITFAYSAGTAIPMLAITYGGQSLLNRVPWLTKNTPLIQKFFGVVMILTAIGIYFNVDRNFQSYVLDKFPSYGVGLTKFEENRKVKEELDRLSDETVNEADLGKLMNDLIGNGYPAPEIIPGGEWINSPPLKLSQLRGKVVLIDFWTYTCINCIRTLPYLRSWYEKYADDGLVIIGIHTPEFEFEKNIENVREAVDDFNLEYPIVQDNNYSTWRAYNNRYWPAKYLIDKNGQVVYTHFGEGDYDETEEAIQELLKDAGSSISESISNPTYQVTARTPETYLGYARMQYLASPESVAKDASRIYTNPNNLPIHRFSFSGNWMVGSEYARPTQGSKLTIYFEAKDVFLVMRPKDDNQGVVRVRLVEMLDENTYRGKDVGGDGTVMVDSDRLYELIKLENSGKHTLELEFLDSNTELYAFTFG